MLIDWSPKWVVNWRLLFRVNSEWLTGERWGILTELVIVKPSRLAFFRLGDEFLTWSFLLEALLLRWGLGGLIKLGLCLDVLAFVDVSIFFALILTAPYLWDCMEVLLSYLLNLYAVKVYLGISVWDYTLLNSFILDIKIIKSFQNRCIQRARVSSP